jgi:RTX calcium-binding nonapeptide repeat (4 copies)
MTTVTVASVAALRTALENAAVTTILVTPGDYTVSDVIYGINGVSYGSGDGFHINRNVTIKADTSGTARANFFAGTNFSKGIFHVVEGASATFDGIGFYNTAGEFGGGQSSNEAGIRHEGVNLTIINGHFENNLNGILGTALNGSNGQLHGDLNVSTSTFIDNGDQTVGAGQEHHIYYTGRSVSVNQSYFRNSGFGHAIKTVVDIGTTVTNSIIEDGGAPANSAVNATGGGTLTITGNTITKSAESQNPYFFFYTTERDGGVSGAINISNNTLNSLKPAGSDTLLLGNYSDQTATFNNNTITGGINTVNPFAGDGAGTGNTLDGAAFTLQTFRTRATSGTATADTRVFAGGGINYFQYDPVNAYNGLGGNDVIIGSFRRYVGDAFFGGDGNDTLSGGDGSDFLYGEGGDDLIFVGEGGSYTTNDSAYGGSGNDRLIVRPADPRRNMNAYLDGGAGNDFIDARNGDGSTIIGGAGDDTALGGIERDDFNGGYGSDIFYAGRGQEGELWGGPADDTGIDTLVYAGAYGVDLAVEISFGIDELLGVTPITASGSAEVGFYESPREFEFLQFSNGSYDTTTKVFTPGLTRVNLATLLATAIPADPGEVTLPFNRASIQALSGASVSGTVNADTIVQTEAGQTISGGNGNDQYILDSYYGNLASYPVINETATGGTDTVFISPGNLGVGGEYTLAANVEIAVTYQLFESYNGLKGNAASNLLVDFDRKNQVIVESEENASLDGGDGNDTLYGGNRNDTLTGGAGTDVAVYRGNRSEYTVATIGATTTVTDNLATGTNDGVDTLTTIEQLRFLDGTLTLAGNTFAAQTNSATSVAFNGGTFSLSTYLFTAGGGGTGGGTVVLGPLTAGGYPTVTTRNGTTAADTIGGGTGVDYYLMPYDGYTVDTLTGGTGNDVYVVGLEDVITEAAAGGWDVMVGDTNMTIRTNVEVLVDNANYSTYVNGNTQANLLIGNNFQKLFQANDGNDVMVGGTAGDQFNGGNGTDTAVLQGNYASYTRSVNGGVTTFTHNTRSEADSIVYTENVRFADGMFTIATSVFSSYTFAGALESDLRNNAATATLLNLPTVFTNISGTGKLFIRGDASDTVAVNSLALQRYDADYVRNGVTYRHYAYGTNDLFVETGVQLTSPFTGVVPINQLVSAPVSEGLAQGDATVSAVFAVQTDDSASTRRTNALVSHLDWGLNDMAKRDYDAGRGETGFAGDAQQALPGNTAQLAQLIQAMASLPAQNGALNSWRLSPDHANAGTLLAASQS